MKFVCLLDRPRFMSLGVLGLMVWPLQMWRTHFTDTTESIATLGSRLFATLANSKKIVCLVLAGYDFPEAVREQLLSWQMTMQMNVLQDRLSTRGFLQYQDDTFGRALSDFFSRGL